MTHYVIHSGRYKTFKNMQLRKIILVIGTLSLLVNFNSCKNSDKHALTKTNEKVISIPFELTSHNNISVKAVLNKLDTLNLMFHTAATSTTLTTEAINKLTNINWDAEQDVNSWGGKSSARYSEINSLEISNMKWDSIAIWETKNSGPTTDGKFGPNLFAGNVIEIAFDKSIIKIHDKLPEEVEGFVKKQLFFEDQFMFVQGISSVNNVNLENRFLIHSGYGGTILFDDKFVAENKIGEQIEIIDEKELKDSYGNVLKTKKGKLPKFTIGEIDFEDMPVGFFEGTIGRQKMSIIGGDLLKRFNIIIDANREYIYIKPNQLTELAYSKI